jgi:hypothetical protein
VTGQETTRLPVRSALFKQRSSRLVVRWVTTSEYPLLYVFCIFFCPFQDPSKRTDSDLCSLARSVAAFSHKWLFSLYPTVLSNTLREEQWSPRSQYNYLGYTGRLIHARVNLMVLIRSMEGSLLYFLSQFFVYLIGLWYTKHKPHFHRTFVPRLDVVCPILRDLPRTSDAIIWPMQPL